MKGILNGILVSFLTLSSFAIEAAGFQMVSVADPGHPDMEVGVWYPSDQAAPSEPNTRFGYALALDAPLGDTNGGLILIAGVAGALADAGYIVAAPSHTGNTMRDMSSTLEQWLIDRPRHISRVIDDMGHRAPFATQIDMQKIGVYGFSAGGYTALGLIGGVPDLDVAKEHCDNTVDEFICSEGAIAGMRAAGMQNLPSDAWGADTRIKAASIAAPGFGFSYTQATLANVTAKVQLWSGTLDESVPTATNAAVLAERLPTKPDTNWMEGASHFAFLTVPCTERFKQQAPDDYY